jgi:hypothetical protein
VLDLRLVQLDQHEREDHEHQQADRRSHHHPLAEADPLTGGLLDEAAADQIGRAAHRCQQSAHTGRVRQHEHDGGADLQPKRVEVFGDLALNLQQLRHDAEDADRGGQQHGDGGGVGDECREQTGDPAEGDDHPGGGLPHAGQRQDAEREAPGETVFEHGLREDEGADEGEHRRGTERAQHVIGRRHTHEDDHRNAEKTADGDRDRLAHPEHDHAEQNAGQGLLLRRDVQWQREEGDRDNRCEEETDGAPALLEPLLTR